jgi:ABC-2 type transport system ATP-binding protein
MLTLHNLRKAFGSVVAVDGLSLAIPRGEVFGLLGPNGAGKSTTINMAVGLVAPDSGTVTLEGGHNPAQPLARRMIGVCPQSLAIYEELTGAENLRFFGSMYGLAGPQLESRVIELLRLVGLSDRASDRARTYSGGMKRRLNLAAAIVHDPPLVMLDEPTVGVDPQSRNALYDIVRGMRASGRTVLYTTHYMEEAERLCDRVGIIDRGKLLALDTVDRLIAAHGGTSVVIVQREGTDGVPNEERIPTADPVAIVSRELAATGSRAPARGLRIERPDLEAVFLNLTGRTLRD